MKTTKTGYEDMSDDQLTKLLGKEIASHCKTLTELDAVNAELKRRKLKPRI